MEVKETRRVILDIEADSLKPKIIWCIVCKDIDTGEVFKFRPNDPFSGHLHWQEQFKEFIKTVKTFIGHNVLAFDIYWINKILDLNINRTKVIDTLVLSRLFRPVSPFSDQLKTKNYLDDRTGGHSLEAWGTRLGFAKIEFNDFSQFTEAMLEYCVTDVELTHKVYLALMQEREGFSDFSIKLEHSVAWMLATQERNGFALDKKAAEDLLNDTTAVLSNMLSNLHEVFPPVFKLVRENFVAKVKADGEIGSVAKRILNQYQTTPGLKAELNPDGSYNLFASQEFNPKSSKQIGERLLSLGWVPRKFTPKGSPATDKEALAEAIEELQELNPELPELNYLANYNLVADRQGKAEKWLELAKEDGKVHGRVNPIGAGTHRCSHYNDNMANIAKVITGSAPCSQAPMLLKKFDLFDEDKIYLGFDEKKKEINFALKGLTGKYGWDSRSCWVASEPDRCLVGADASGIQLRALAHYMNDPEYTRKLLEDDIHTVHQQAAGISTRPRAKTFIYAWLLGAGDPKIGKIVGVTEEEYEALFAFASAKYYRNYRNPRDKSAQNLLSFYIDNIRHNGGKATKQYIATCIKGFKVKEQFLDRTPALKRLKTKDIPEATKQGYLLGLDGRKLWIPNEHLAMSMYLQGFEAVVMKLAMHYYHKDLESKNIPFWQVAMVHDEFVIETYPEFGEEIGQSVVNSIKRAGEKLGSNCPLDGSFFVGKAWSEIH